VLSVPLEPSGPLSFLGPWTKISEKFVNATSPWIERLEIEIRRIAFGCVLLLRVERRDDAYARLSELLSSVSVKPEMRDLIYRVNWRKNSAVVHELIINRITTFASISISRATVTVDNIAPMLLEPPAEFVRLEMDHNTVQEWGKVFDREHVVRIYEELISIAGDNAARGEVR